MRKILTLTIIATLISFLACNDTLELSLLDDPNNPTPKTTDLETLYNSVQLSFEGFLSAPQGFTMQLSRQIALVSGNNYQSAFSPTSFDNTWRQAYSNFMPDANAVIARAETTEQLFHSGTTKIMKAYVLATLVDLFGDVPLEDSNQGIEILSPNVQSGETIYETAKELALDGIFDLEENTSVVSRLDNMYNGDSNGWLAAANSLILKLAVNTRDFVSFNALIQEGDFINSQSLDWHLNIVLIE